MEQTGYDDSDGNIILNMSRTESSSNDFYLPTQDSAPDSSGQKQVLTLFDGIC